ncbi:MAG: sulfatase-like hydrolase/transferase [Rickettsiaceae bacterium]|nr:sulfatase-like hydrolase/transferase [Rickettsiaceae bacterium]
MYKIFKIFSHIINYKISLKELYFSFTTWFVLLVLFLGLTTKFQTSLLIANILIALAVYLIIILITNRIILSGFLTLLLAVSFDYIRHIKWQFLQQDLSAADIFMLKLLINHGLFRLIYEYATKEIYLVFILLFINFVLLWNKSDTLLSYKNLGKRNYYALRVVSFGVAVLLVFKLMEIAADKKSIFYQTIYETKTKYANYSRPIYGPFGDVLFTIRDIYIKPNKGSIDINNIVTASKKYRLNNKINPSKLDYDFAEKLQFDFFKKNKYTKYLGVLNVNTYGGSSWISEYEINTGIPHKSFSGPSYMPFITLVPETENSLIFHLRAKGYRTEVVYPVDKDFSLAKESYGKLGIHKISDIYEYGFKPESWGHIPDAMINEMILNILDRNPEEPKYIFAATMLNHGPHSSFFPDEIGCSRVMNDKLCSKLNDYIKRLYHTNEDQMSFIYKLMNRKKKTILVHFGDHLPSFEGYSTQLRFTRDINDYCKTFYHVVANFDIDLKDDYNSLDITFIPSLILDMAKLNNDQFYLANSFIRRKCNGNMANCSGKNDNLDNLLESYKSLIVKQLGF